MLAQALEEESNSVVAAIGRALSAFDISATLVQWMVPDHANGKLAACRLARWQKPHQQLREAIKPCLDDGDPDIVAAAMRTLAAWQDGEATDRLLVALSVEPSRSRKWVLLDALIDTADPGDAQRAWPAWAFLASKVLDNYMQDYLDERLQKRREDMKKDAAS